MKLDLQKVLWVKIIFTAFLWAGPLLILPLNTLDKLGVPVIGPPIFLRLLGMAFLSLLVGYCMGLRIERSGDYPVQAVTVGIVSNAGAFLVLLYYAWVGAWQQWSGVAPYLMWISLVATGLITLGLLVFGPGKRGQGS